MSAHGAIRSRPPKPSGPPAGRAAPMLLLVAAVVVSACSSGTGAKGDRAAGTEVQRPLRTLGAWDWPTYGHDAQHTFHGRTTLVPHQVTTLGQAWFLPTGDAVTATPTVVHGTVYVGSWDGFFYAVDLRTGALRWKFRLDPQPAVSPQPGQTPRDFSSDGGMVTSSAWFEPGRGKRPDLVIFGGGYTLYALEAGTGRLHWSHQYTGRPDRPADPDHDDTRIFSSPVVADRKVIIGVSVDGSRGRRGYIVAARLDTGAPAWTFESDIDVQGRVLNDGCGSVWSSGTVLPRPGLVVFDVGDCHFDNPLPLSETIIALRIADGRLVWSHRPARRDTQCDLDFGATVNVGLGRDRQARFLGVGGKDGTYYSLDPKTGQERWKTNVVFGGFAGGFIATAAYDGRRVYGSTALGDFGRFEGGGTVHCDPGNPRDLPFQEPTVHSFDASTGRVAWQASKAASFAPTTVAGGMTFNGVALSKVVQVRDAATGRLIKELPVSAPCWSGVATVGNAVVFGTGASQQGTETGILAFTPGGRPPVVPGGS